MKTLSSLLITILMSTATCYCQTVTIQQLIEKTKCKDYNCFNSFITGKGFSFSKKFDLTASKMYRYSSNKEFAATSNTAITSKNISSITFYTNGSVGTSWGSSVQAQYQSLIKELATLKFIEQGSTDEDDGTVAVLYKSAAQPKISITVRTMTVEKEGMGSWIYYDFQTIRRK